MFYVFILAILLPRFLPQYPRSLCLCIVRHFSEQPAVPASFSAQIMYHTIIIVNSVVRKKVGGGRTLQFFDRRLQISDKGDYE